MYYAFIETQMMRGKVYVLEGIKAFSRIIKSTKHPEILEVIGTFLPTKPRSCQA